jgi:hypothetical protein
MTANAKAWAVSLGIAGAAALAFLLATLLTGDYDWVARIGGSVWVFLLAMIILLPTVMPLMSRREQRPLRGP